MLPPSGQPKRVELVHHPKTTGERTFIMEVDQRPRELQTDNNRIERVDHGPQGEAQGPLRRQRAALRVPLPEELSRARRDDRPERRPALVRSRTTASRTDRRLPTFPAAKDDLFAYDVVIFGDADTSFMSQSQMQNLVEFVTEKGGGVLFVAGELFNPLAYRGTPLELLLPIELVRCAQPHGRRNDASRAFRPELTLEGRAQPDLPVRRRRSRRACRSGNGCPSCSGTSRHRARSRRRWCWPSTRRSIGSDGKLPLVLYQFVGPARRCSMRSTIPGGWRFRAGDKYFGRFWVQTIRFLARSKTGRPASGRGPDRPQAISARTADPASRPVSRTRRWHPRPATSRSRSNERGQGPRKLALKLVPGTRNVFEGALPQAAEGDYEVRLLPPPVLDGPIPTASFRVDAPVNEFERIEMNEPELIRAAESTGGKFYTPLDAGTLLRDLPKPSQVPLDTDPPIPLWNTWPVLTCSWRCSPRSGFSENANKWYDSCLVNRHGTRHRSKDQSQYTNTSMCVRATGPGRPW